MLLLDFDCSIACSYTRSPTSYSFNPHTQAVVKPLAYQHRCAELLHMTIFVHQFIVRILTSVVAKRRCVVKTKDSLLRKIWNGGNNRIASWTWDFSGFSSPSCVKEVDMRTLGNMCELWPFDIDGSNRVFSRRSRRRFLSKQSGNLFPPACLRISQFREKENLYVCREPVNMTI